MRKLIGSAFIIGSLFATASADPDTKKDAKNTATDVKKDTKDEGSTVKKETKDAGSTVKEKAKNVGDSPTEKAESYGELKGHRDGTRSIYIADPSGNPVELMDSASL